MSVREGDDVWVLSIDHQYGNDTIVFTTEEAAKASLLEFVTEYWESEINSFYADDDPDRIPMPEDPEEAIAEYFFRVEVESYFINCATVQGVKLTP